MFILLKEQLGQGVNHRSEGLLNQFLKTVRAGSSLTALEQLESRALKQNLFEVTNYHKIVHRFTAVSLESGSSHRVQAMNFLMMPVAKMSSLIFIVKVFCATGQQQHHAAAKSMKTAVRTGILARMSPLCSAERYAQVGRCFMK